MSASLEMTLESCSEPGSTKSCASMALPSCCHSGCTVCVLDYPELFQQAELSEHELTLLLAMEQALNAVDHQRMNEQQPDESQTQP